jgi:predicted branched-subunit amino acid permease
MEAMSAAPLRGAARFRMVAPMVAPTLSFSSNASAYLGGVRAAWTSVFAYVLFGTYIGIGALGHDFGFSLPWVLLSTILVWAAPAQVILISTLGAGAAMVEIAIAVGLSGVRLLPMVVSLLPVLRTPQTRQYELLMPAHFTAISMWVESMRLVPLMPVERRIPFCNGLASGYMVSALVASVAGFYLAAQLPTMLTAGLLFLTPITFLVSVARNSQMLVDQLALALGLVIGPLLAWWEVGLDIMWTGIIGGTAAYLVHRIREATR